jgi:arginine decarboxylase
MECLLQEAQAGFANGELDLDERAAAERIYFALARAARAGLRPATEEQRALLARLDGLLAERVFCNFSIFQSLPDVWAIDQVFPVMPLQRLDEDPERAAVLHDLTCDSDGCIGAYVEQGAVETTLRLHAGRPGEQYLLGIFLVGAYQEILGDMHNLFGDTDAVNVRLDPDGAGYRLAGPEPGDAAGDVLRYVHFEPERMLERYREILDAAGLGEAAADACFAELEAGLYGYTYLE